LVTLFTALIIIGTLFLAYANGANDNFKGVSTLFGSNTTSYKKALFWASLATLLGSLTALILAQELIIVFTGKGLVPDNVIQMRSFPMAVGIGAALTVMLATLLSLPVSTTHALIGALAGAGWVASANGINWVKLSGKFFMPLIAGPLISVALAFLIYPLFRKLRKKLGIEKETCLCVGKKIVATAPVCMASKAEFLSNYSHAISVPEAIIGDQAYCRSSYSGKIISISTSSLLDVLHYFSSGLVCFARGLNDTPKIAALLLIGSHFSLEVSILSVGIAMLIGGIIHSKRIANTMGNRITEMNPGQAFTANLITGIMVVGASKIGVPVSTTHVSCGSIFGIGAVTGQARWKTVRKIIMAWITTLPMGLILGAITLWALS
jgi:PiT family inorganic phosphate transporter